MAVAAATSAFLGICDDEDCVCIWCTRRAAITSLTEHVQAHPPTCECWRGALEALAGDPGRVTDGDDDDEDPHADEAFAAGVALATLRPHVSDRFVLAACEALTNRRVSGRVAWHQALQTFLQFGDDEEPTVPRRRRYRWKLAYATRRAEVLDNIPLEIQARSRVIVDEVRGAVDGWVRRGGGEGAERCADILRDNLAPVTRSCLLDGSACVAERTVCMLRAALSMPPSSSSDTFRAIAGALCPWICDRCAWGIAGRPSSIARARDDEDAQDDDDAGDEEKRPWESWSEVMCRTTVAACVTMGIALAGGRQKLRMAAMGMLYRGFHAVAARIDVQRPLLPDAACNVLRVTTALIGLLRVVVAAASLAGQDDDEPRNRQTWTRPQPESWWRLVACRCESLSDPVVARAFPRGVVESVVDDFQRLVQTDGVATDGIASMWEVAGALARCTVSMTAFDEATCAVEPLRLWRYIRDDEEDELPYDEERERETEEANQETADCAPCAEIAGATNVPVCKMLCEWLVRVVERAQDDRRSLASLVTFVSPVASRCGFVWTKVVAQQAGERLVAATVVWMATHLGLPVVGCGFSVPKCVLAALCRRGDESVPVETAVQRVRQREQENGEEDVAAGVVMRTAISSLWTAGRRIFRSIRRTTQKRSPSLEDLEKGANAVDDGGDDCDSDEIQDEEVDIDVIEMEAREQVDTIVDSIGLGVPQEEAAKLTTTRTSICSWPDLEHAAAQITAFFRLLAGRWKQSKPSTTTDDTSSDAAFCRLTSLLQPWPAHNGYYHCIALLAICASTVAGSGDPERLARLMRPIITNLETRRVTVVARDIALCIARKLPVADAEAWDDPWCNCDGLVGSVEADWYLGAVVGEATRIKRARPLIVACRAFRAFVSSLSSTSVRYYLDMIRKAAEAITDRKAECAIALLSTACVATMTAAASQTCEDMGPYLKVVLACARRAVVEVTPSSHQTDDCSSETRQSTTTTTASAVSSESPRNEGETDPNDAARRALMDLCTCTGVAIELLCQHVCPVSTFELGSLVLAVHDLYGNAGPVTAAQGSSLVSALCVAASREDRPPEVLCASLETLLQDLPETSEREEAMRWCRGHPQQRHHVL